jgi:hypothetical protein
MLRIGVFPSALLVFMGSIDCLTTVVGVLYFRAVELNPIIAGIVNTSLPAFVILKLATTVLVGLIFVQTEKILMKTSNKTTKAFNFTKKLLKCTYVGIIIFLAIVVANNFIVLTNAI